MIPLFSLCSVIVTAGCIIIFKQPTFSFFHSNDAKLWTNTVHFIAGELCCFLWEKVFLCNQTKWTIGVALSWSRHPPAAVQRSVISKNVRTPTAFIDEQYRGFVRYINMKATFIYVYVVEKLTTFLLLS